MFILKHELSDRPWLHATIAAPMRGLRDTNQLPTLCVFAGEVVKSKSPAEFFADNQNIAGFDNVSCLDTYPLLAVGCMDTYPLIPFGGNERELSHTA